MQTGPDDTETVTPAIDADRARLWQLHLSGAVLHDPFDPTEAREDDL